MSTDLINALVAWICHDLASPVGALTIALPYNATDVLKPAVEQLADKLTLFRFLFITHKATFDEIEHHVNVCLGDNMINLKEFTKWQDAMFPLVFIMNSMRNNNTPIQFIPLENDSLRLSYEISSYYKEHLNKIIAGNKVDVNVYNARIYYLRDKIFEMGYNMVIENQSSLLVRKI